MDKKLHQNIEMMNLDEFMEVHTLGGQPSSTTGKVTYFNLCDVSRQMASKLQVIKDSSIFKMCWRNRVEELSRDRPNTDETESPIGNEMNTVDYVYHQIFLSCYSKYKALYDGLKSQKVLLEDIDSIVEVYKAKYEDLLKDLNIMCRLDPHDNRKWTKDRISQIQHYCELHLAMESSKIIMDIRNMICPEGDFKVLEKLLQMVHFPTI